MATDRLLERTLAALRTLRQRALEFQAVHAGEIEAVEPHFRNSARNLLHYLSSRAECVMLNKGPRVVSTVEFLVDILNRMEEHHDKRMALLRRLSVSEI